jgi:PadR family transcriptional regulator PadR
MSANDGKSEVLDLLVLQTLETLGPMHGWGIARRIEQVSDNLLQMNQGTIYPALLRLEQAGWIRSEWGISENNRRARFYALTPPGRRRLRAEKKNWDRMCAMITRVLRSEV